MATQTPLYVLFTMNCLAPGVRGQNEAPRNWDVSSRSIEGFATRTIRAGFPPVLFSSVECLVEHEPLFEELTRRGAEIGLYLHPPQIGDGGFAKPLGQYNATDQRALIDYAAERFADIIGTRPRSFRGGLFSASDETYRILFDLGFRQGSLSDPGRHVAIRAAEWRNAPSDPHYVDPESRLKVGSLPFLEIPVTNDQSRELGRGVPLSLQIEVGSFEEMHQPTLQKHLERLKKEDAAFHLVCFHTNNWVDYVSETERPAQSIEAALDYLEGLQTEYEVIPVTATIAHDRYRMHLRSITDQEH